MKCITICQPYAELILLGVKRVENRTWATSHRGLLAIHAGKSRAWLDGYRPLPEHLDFGAIVGVAMLRTVVHRLHIFSGIAGKRPTMIPEELFWLRDHPHVEGPYCWVLAEVRRLPVPIPYVGRQGLFEVPDELIQLPKRLRELIEDGNREATP